MTRTGLGQHRFLAGLGSTRAVIMRYEQFVTGTMHAVTFVGLPGFIFIV